ncbi:MAG: DinB family protein [Cyclobacteriaceae bacterium]
MRTLESLQKILVRDLDLLAAEISAYPSESSLWIIKGDIKNSGGNLCLHLVGNLQHFIGAVLGNTGYKRNREAEFSDKDIPKEDLLSQIEETKKAIIATFAQLDSSKLGEEYPIQVFGEPMTVEYFLIHLATHLTYHRGQINYHRRLLS